MRTRISAVLIVLAFTVPAFAQMQKAAAPSTKSTAADPVRTIVIVGTDDMKYSVTRIVAKPGEQLRIRLVSKGTLPKIAMAHNVVVLKPGTDVAKFVEAGAPFRATDFIAASMKGSVLAKTGFAGPGETVEVLFKVPGPGVFPYVCTFPGHYLAGMVGQIVAR